MIYCSRDSLALVIRANFEMQLDVKQFLASLRRLRAQSNELLKATGKPALAEIVAGLDDLPAPAWVKSLLAEDANAATKPVGARSTSADLDAATALAACERRQANGRQCAGARAQARSR